MFHGEIREIYIIKLLPGNLKPGIKFYFKGHYINHILIC